MSSASRPIGNEAAIHPSYIPFETIPSVCYSSRGTPFFGLVPVGMPKLGQYQGILDIVFFLYESAEAAEVGKDAGGTGFLVSVPSKGWPDQYHHVYGVTNWHNACRDGCSVIRLNTKEGAHDIFDYGPELWQFIPGDHDVAVVPLRVRDIHRVKYLDPGFLITDDQIKEWEIGPGDDVFMAGRFVDYDGVQTNKPAVRFGHISMSGAPVRQANGCTAESFVLDMHSRTGFSGSPVFVYRTLGSEFLNIQGKILTGISHTMSLLGIHWGQFPELWELKDEQRKEEIASDSALITEGKYVKGLSGMTCVSPATAIKRALDMPKLRALREATEREWVKQLGQPSAAPIVESAPPTTDGNPQHREDFSRLLDAAAKGRKPSPRKV